MESLFKRQDQYRVFVTSDCRLFTRSLSRQI